MGISCSLKQSPGGDSHSPQQGMASPGLAVLVRL